MPLDDTDKRLVNGAILAAVLLGIVYFWPWDVPFAGYSKQAEQQQSARQHLHQTNTRYATSHPAMRPVHFGSGGAEPLAQDGELHLLTQLKSRFNDANSVTQQLVGEKQLANKINFPEWTNIPADAR